MTDNYILLYITCPDSKTAEKIAENLVENHLIACANIIPGITSIYRWKDEIHRDGEVILTAKTVTDNFDMIAEKVKSLHPYECPCIVSFNMASGTKEFLQWIDDTIVS